MTCLGQQIVIQTVLTQFAFYGLQLLQYGAAVDAVDPAKGRTALHRAVKGSVMMYPMDVKIITLLVDSGANHFSADKKGGPQCQAHVVVPSSLTCLMYSEH